MKCYRLFSSIIFPLALAFTLLAASDSQGAKKEKESSQTSSTTCELPLKGQTFSAETVEKGNFSIDLSRAFTTDQVAQVENNVKACQSLISSRLMGFQDKGSVLMRDKASIEGLQNIKAQLDTSKALEMEKVSIKDTLSKDISQVNLKGLYAVVLEADLKTPRDKLLDMAKKLIAPQAISDLRGVAINSVTVVEESRLVFDRVVAETSGEMDIEVVTFEDRKSFTGKSQLLYVAVVRVNPLTGSIKHEKPAGAAAKGFVADLLSLEKNAVFFKQELAKYTSNVYANDKMKSLEEIVSVWQNVIQQGNAQANKKTGELLAQLAKRLKDKDDEIKVTNRKIEDSRKKLNEVYDLVGYKCSGAPEACLNDAIAHMDGEIDKVIKASIVEKEREFVSAKGIVIGAGDPEKEIQRLVQDFYKNLKTTYSKREQFLSLSVVENAALTSAEDKQGYYIVRSPRDVTVYPFYDENGNMLSMVVMSFRVEQESDGDKSGRKQAKIKAADKKRDSRKDSSESSDRELAQTKKELEETRKKLDESKKKREEEKRRFEEDKKQREEERKKADEEKKHQESDKKRDNGRRQDEEPVKPKPVKRGGGREADPETGMEFVFIQGGCFQMGSNEKDSKDIPLHEVCLDSFYIGKYEVTQGEWKKIMGRNPSSNNKGDDYPVEKVNWQDAREFTEKLSKLTGRKYRLPTEAEWEYAARARGGNTVWSGANSESDLENHAWYKKNSSGKTHPVGQKSPNKLGIYDMTGNVWEWVEDSFSSDAYKKHKKNNPLNESRESRGLRRGGSVKIEPKDMKNVSRDGHQKKTQSDDHGFRVVMSADR